MKDRIFISGNQKELKNERNAVKELILHHFTLRDCFNVFLFEDLPAKGSSPVSTYISEVERSDIYIGILGNDYGFKGKNGLSPTETEYYTFIKLNPKKDVLIFIKGHDDSLRDEEMLNFISRLKEPYIYKRFNDVKDLKVEVLNSLISCLDDAGKLIKDDFDQSINIEANYDSIDEKEVIDFLNKRALKLNVSPVKISPKKFLRDSLKVLKEYKGVFKPTNAALLFFGKTPSEFLPQNEIKVARFKGLTRSEIIDSQSLKGPIYNIIENVEIFLKRNTRVAKKIVDFERIDIPEYPYAALREAVINAIAHRDYTHCGAPVMFAIFDDRIEIKSPGGLLSGLNINDLEGHHVTRNIKICDIFHKTKDMEELGTGITRMNDAMKNHGLPVPEFSEEGDSFVVKFYGPGENILDLVSKIPDERKTDLRGLGLNQKQIEALKLMVNEGKIFTNPLYQDTFNVSKATAARHLKALVTKDQAIVTGKGKNTIYKAV